MGKNSSTTRRRRAGLDRTLGTLGIGVATTLLTLPAWAQNAFTTTEDFSTNTLEGSPTTADWDTITGVLKLPTTTSPSPIQSLTGALDGTAATTTLDTGRDTRAVALGDLDGDGDIDAAFVNNGRNTVYFNDGSGGLVIGNEIPGVNDQNSNSRDVALADFNGDGYLDFVKAEFGQNQATRVLFNNGSGGTQIFAAGDFVDVGPTSLKAWAVAAGDMNGDGFPDLVIGADGDDVQIAFNDGYGNFTAPVDVVDTEAMGGDVDAVAIALGDIDNDNDLDIVAGLRLGSTRIFFNEGDGTFNLTTEAAGATESPIPSNNLVFSGTIALGDVNGDGWLDIVVGNDTTSGANTQDNRLFLNAQSSPYFPTTSLAFTDRDYTTGVELVDVDLDGDLDLVTSDRAGANTAGTNKLYINNAGTLPAAGTPITAGSNISSDVALGDLDGDGDLDMVVGIDGPRNEVVLNTGTPSGIAADQLVATARSQQFNSAGDDLSGGVILTTVENGGLGTSNDLFDYWVSADGGLNWVAAALGRSVSFPEPLGNDLRWRVEISAASPSATWKREIDSLTIDDNDLPRFPSAQNDPQGTAGTATEGTLYSYEAIAFDNDGERLLLRPGADFPDWLTLEQTDERRATISGTPAFANVGDNAVSVEVIDGSGLLGSGSTLSWTITVSDDGVNDPPAVTMPTGDQTFSQGDTVNLAAGMAFSDPEGDALTFSATGLPTGLTIDPMTGAITGTLTNDDAVNGPTYNVTVTADDDVADTMKPTTDDAFILTVNNVNDAPTFTSTAVVSATIGVAYSYAITTEDIDLDTVTITSAGEPTWLTFTDNGDGTASLSGTPAAGDEGGSSITLTVDDTALQGTQAFTLTVSATPNTDPTITVTGDNPLSVVEGTMYMEPGVTAADAEDGDLTASIVTTGSVDTSTVGTYTLTYTVTDSGGLTASATRTVNVVAASPANTAPTITVLGDNPAEVTEGDAYTDAGASASDAEDGDLSASVVTTGSVDTSTVGTYTLTYTVTDSGGLTATTTRSVTVVAAPPPPPPPTPTPPPAPAPSGGGGGGASGPFTLLLMLTGLVALRRRQPGS